MENPQIQMVRSAIKHLQDLERDLVKQVTKVPTGVSADALLKDHRPAEVTWKRVETPPELKATIRSTPRQYNDNFPHPFPDEINRIWDEGTLSEFLTGVANEIEKLETTGSKIVDLEIGYVRNPPALDVEEGSKTESKDADDVSSTKEATPS